MSAGRMARSVVIANSRPRRKVPLALTTSVPHGKPPPVRSDDEPIDEVAGDRRRRNHPGRSASGPLGRSLAALATDPAARGRLGDLATVDAPAGPPWTKARVPRAVELETFDGQGPRVGHGQAGEGRPVDAMTQLVGDARRRRPASKRAAQGAPDAREAPGRRPGHRGEAHDQLAAAQGSKGRKADRQADEAGRRGRPGCRRPGRPDRPTLAASAAGQRGGDRR